MTTYGPYVGVVRDIHDGDTLGIDLDLGFGLYLLTKNPMDASRNLTCRVFGINAPELGTKEGRDALAFLLSILPLGARVSVTSHGWDRNGGRFDGDVVIVKTGLSVADEMVKAGHAVAKTYAKQPPPPSPVQLPPSHRA